MDNYTTFKKRDLSIFVITAKAGHLPLKDAHQLVSEDGHLPLKDAQQLVSEDFCQLPTLWKIIYSVYTNNWFTHIMLVGFVKITMSIVSLAFLVPCAYYVCFLYCRINHCI